MFLSHYPDMDHEALAGGWAPGYEDHRYSHILAGCAEFARKVADSAAMDLGRLDDER
jgi:hypothetical protein